MAFCGDLYSSDLVLRGHPFKWFTYSACFDAASSVRVGEDYHLVRVFAAKRKPSEVGFVVILNVSQEEDFAFWRRCWSDWEAILIRVSC